MRKNRTTLKKTFLIAVVLLLFFFSSYRPKPKFFEKDFPPLSRLGTSVQIKVIAKDEIATVHAFNAAISAIDNANNIFNPYSETSELSMAVSKARNGPVEISNELYFILKQSLNYNELTNGAFDITISNLIDLWKNAQLDDKIPTTKTIIDTLNQKTGTQYIILTAPENHKKPLLHINNPEISLNVSAIAKGYITDLAANAMKKVPDVYSGMVNIGGEIVCFNNTSNNIDDSTNTSYNSYPESYNSENYNLNDPDNGIQQYLDNPPVPSPYLQDVRQYQKQMTYSDIKIFPIGITNPFEIENAASPQTHSWVVNLTNHAIASSGNYRQYFTIEGKRFSHIIDPKTGYPALQASGSTVIAPNCMQADALATAFSVMNPDEAIALAESLTDIEAMIIYGTLDSPQILKTTLFDNFMKKQ